jgi:hypothetical protein
MPLRIFSAWIKSVSVAHRSTSRFSNRQFVPRFNRAKPDMDIQ